MLTSTLDPVVIRQKLEAHRDAGHGWEVAWRDSVGYVPATTDERTMYAFMERNFRAAYHDTPSSLGRFDVPGTDTSTAIIAGILRAAPTPVENGRCRSGDGCDHIATRGRFGPRFCERHYAELVRLTDKSTLSTTIPGTQGQAA